MRILVASLAAVVLAGCGTTQRHGSVGDALKGDHVQAKLLDFVPRVPDKRLGHDNSGLNAPARGMRFAAADVALCNDTGAAAIEWAFTLRLADGSTVHPSIASSVYPDMMQTVRNGCDSGWLIYPVPARAKAVALRYRFDYSHRGSYGSSSATDSEHDRFDWSL